MSLVAKGLQAQTARDYGRAMAGIRAAQESVRITRSAAAAEPVDGTPPEPEDGNNAGDEKKRAPDPPKAAAGPVDGTPPEPEEGNNAGDEDLPASPLEDFCLLTMRSSLIPSLYCAGALRSTLYLTSRSLRSWL